VLQDVVAAHGGRLSIVSETGVAHGTTVTLRLPVADSAEGP
jgi:signal transduction histidine kinase